MEKKYQEIKIEDKLPKNGYVYFVNYINHRGEYDKGAFEFNYNKWNGLPEGVVISWLEDVYK